MGTNIGYIMTLANGIIGVSILAMPFCFKQCGIILSLLMLFTSNVISRCACHFLLKSAIMARRRTFEILAFHAFGSAGKFFVEIGIIGFLLGTCIAFFVVVGDLGPAIITNVFELHQISSDTLRSTVMITVALFCVIPLGLLRNVESLSSVCTATVGFYFCLVIKIILEALPHILFGDWVTKVELWQTSGILQCLPIFSMALFCQTQLFEIFETIPNASLESMNLVVRGAVNICTAVYIFVGVFGYIAFCAKPFSGNILMSFTPSITTDVIKIGFVLSVAFSFPVVIFPCRSSLHSLLFRKGQLPQDSSYVSYIPEYRFRWLTIFIVMISLFCGLLIPSIELVLGLVGSTIGVMICVLFPATCFICMTTKNTNERILAQIMLTIGILVMVLGTYANLYAIEEVVSIPTTFTPKTEMILKAEKLDNNLAFNQDFILKEAIKEPVRIIPAAVHEEMKQKLEKNKIIYNKTKIIESEISQNEIRHEPPQPIEPEEPNRLKLSLPVEIVTKLPPEIHKINDIIEEPKSELKIEEKINKEVIKEAKEALKKEEVNKDALKKEDVEIAEESKNEDSTPNAALDLIEKLKAEGKKQEKMLEEAKQVLAEIKEQKEDFERKQQIGELEKHKVALEIQKIANIAIESLANNNQPIVQAPEVVKKDSGELGSKDLIKTGANNTKIISDAKFIPLPLVNRSNLGLNVKTNSTKPKIPEKIDKPKEVVENKVDNGPKLIELTDKLIKPDIIEKISNKMENEIVKPNLLEIIPRVVKQSFENEIPNRDILSNDNIETGKNHDLNNPTTVKQHEPIRLKRDTDDMSEKNDQCDLCASRDSKQNLLKISK